MGAKAEQRFVASQFHGDYHDLTLFITQLLGKPSVGRRNLAVVVVIRVLTNIGM